MGVTQQIPPTQFKIHQKDPTKAGWIILTNSLADDGQPPASKASIEGMPSVEAKEGDECVICLEEMGGVGNLAKEMPCRHSFHGGCIEKWLNIHGSCPVCRYKMPVDDDFGVNNKNNNNNNNNNSNVAGREARERRGIRITFFVTSNRDTTSGDFNHTVMDQQVLGSM